MKAKDWLEDFLYNFICAEKDISNHLDVFNSNIPVEDVFRVHYYVNSYSKKHVDMFLDEYKFEKDSNDNTIIVYKDVKVSCNSNRIDLDDERFYIFEILDHNFSDVAWFKDKPNYVIEFKFKDNGYDMKYVWCRILHKKLVNMPTYVYEELE